MGVLEGKVAVITGSSRGLGLAIAQAYAREGAAVVLASRSSTALAEAAEALERQGARASWQVTDVGELEQVKALADHVVKMFGNIDIWVNNAGYGGIYGPTATIAPQDSRACHAHEYLRRILRVVGGTPALSGSGDRGQADQSARARGYHPGAFPERLCFEQSLGA